MSSMTEIDAKYGRARTDMAYTLCEQLREDQLPLRSSGPNAKRETFDIEMKSYYPELTDDDLGALYGYGMMLTR